MEKRLKPLEIIFLILFGISIISCLYNVGTAKTVGMVTLSGMEVLISVLIGGGTICAVMWKYILGRYRKIKKEVETMRKLDILIPAIEKMLPVIERMEKQLYPNGGSSPIDAINRIEVNMDGLTANLKDLKYDLTDLKISQRSFFDSMEIAYWVSDEKGLCTFASNALCKLMGRTEDEIKGNNWATWLHPSTKNVFDIWQDSIQNQMVFDEDYIYRRNDGMWQKVNGFATHKIIDGKYSGSIGRLTKIGEPYR